MTIEGKAQLRPLAPRQELRAHDSVWASTFCRTYFSVMPKEIRWTSWKSGSEIDFSLLKQHPRIPLQGHWLYRSNEQRGCGGKALLGRCCLRTHPAQPNLLGPSSSPTELWQPLRQDHLIQLDVEIELKGLS